MAVKEVKLCLLGESGVGKSSIVQRFVHDTFRPAMESTIGASFLTKTLEVDGKIFKYQIWDTAGQEKYRALAPMYYRGALAAIIVYDITNECSFNTLKEWITELHKHGPPNIVIAIAGNKNDLDELREVRERDAQSYADSMDAVFVETSAKTAANVPALFAAISKKLPSDDFTASTQAGNIALQKAPSSPRKKKCCSQS